ncbi:hypothetical protein ILUMI_00088 [Ignelater luminosus]|uniref:Peptidase S1 domain-containing protein n=1 Tax=Ignelater luminosus TaxID=2038154 RepID=A0A8K0GMZ0_IGNLU|nr:hypothetical protein ILUMI_00088 [Ignelater luminosus]
MIVDISCTRMIKCNLLITVLSLTILNIFLLPAVLVKVFARRGCPVASTNVIQKERIVGGRTVPMDKFYFIAAISIVLPKTSFFQCGSSIIAAHWVITAAHCIDLLKGFPLRLLYIASGHKEWRKGERHKIVRMIKHRDYEEIHYVNDTALIEVKEPFNMGTEMPVRLAGLNYVYKENSSATVIGWGVNETNSTIVQETLYAVDVLVFSQEFCHETYGKGMLTDDMFCAGTYEGGRDACVFDSGGPLVQKNILIGIVSWGGNCGDKTEPGVYAKMSYFIHWLENVEKEQSIKIGYLVQNSDDKDIVGYS